MNNEIHLINKAKYMSNIIFDLTGNELPKKLNILDFGCGDGLFAEKLGQNGFTLHWFPSKYYLPYEPHIYVPLANYFLPNVSKWWLGFWAIIGVRNEYQDNCTWHDVMNLNYKYCKTGLAYFNY